MDRPRLIRGLRIAWSVWWGIVCVLFIVVWVRSYTNYDLILYSANGQVIGTGYKHGIIAVGRGRELLQEGWNVRTIQNNVTLGGRHWGFDYQTFRPSGFEATAPLWCPVLCAATIAAFAWIRWTTRFSLRTLLIATTLIAVVLGLVAAFGR